MTLCLAIKEDPRDPTSAWHLLSDACETYGDGNKLGPCHKFVTNGAFLCLAANGADFELPFRKALKDTSFESLGHCARDPWVLAEAMHQAFTHYGVAGKAEEWSVLAYVVATHEVFYIASDFSAHPVTSHMCIGSGEPAAMASLETQFLLFPDKARTAKMALMAATVAAARNSFVVPPFAYARALETDAAKPIYDVFLCTSGRAPQPPEATSLGSARDVVSTLNGWIRPGFVF